MTTRLMLVDGSRPLEGGEVRGRVGDAIASASTRARELQVDTPEPETPVGAAMGEESGSREPSPDPGATGESDEVSEPDDASTNAGAADESRGTSLLKSLEGPGVTESDAGQGEDATSATTAQPDTVEPSVENRAPAIDPDPIDQPEERPEPEPVTSDDDEQRRDDERDRDRKERKDEPEEPRSRDAPRVF